jgi:hypothetical protein
MRVYSPVRVGDIASFANGILCIESGRIPAHKLACLAEGGAPQRRIEGGIVDVADQRR